MEPQQSDEMDNLAQKGDAIIDEMESTITFLIRKLTGVNSDLTGSQTTCRTPETGELRENKKSRSPTADERRPNCFVLSDVDRVNKGTDISFPPSEISMSKECDPWERNKVGEMEENIDKRNEHFSRNELHWIGDWINEQKKDPDWKPRN